MQNSIGLGEFLQPKANAAAFFFWLSNRYILPVRPNDPLTTKGPIRDDYRIQIPDAASIHPLMRIGILEISPEEETTNLIVEPERVVPNADGARSIEATPHLSGEVMLGESSFEAFLRRNPRKQHAFRGRKIVFARLHIQRFARTSIQKVQISIGTTARKLRGSIASAVQSECFQVVPVKRLFRLFHEFFSFYARTTS